MNKIRVQCDILLENGIIAKIEKSINVELADEIIDCSGKTVIPGFVDAHTHPVFDGDRSNEFGMKLAGVSYMEIHAAGGGIHYTVQKTKEASEELLVEKMLARLDQMISQGTLTIEAKSGYGLEVIRSLWGSVKESILFFRQGCGTTLGVQPCSISRKLRNK